VKTVCVVTGTRAEYGILRPVMRAVEGSDSLSLQVTATGMHLDDERGRTIDEIGRDGFRIDATVPLSPEGDAPADMGRAVGRGISDLIDTLERLNPDVVLVLGDRTEPFAAAIATMFLGKCLAHVHGGDRSRGGFDESMRHAITKLAHLHFAATEKSAERIRRMGERPEHVHVVGAPGLDEALAGPFRDPDQLGVDPSAPPIVVVQHPVSTRPDDAGREMTETMEAVVAEDATVIVVYPNNDPGGRRMIEVIRSYENRGNVTTFANIPRTDFLSLMKCAAVLVGNSSSGMIEAASFRLPVVNVGERQVGRERSGNVIDVPTEREAIASAIHKALVDKDFRQGLATLENPYGDGHASARIVKVLEELDINHDLIQKQIAY